MADLASAQATHSMSIACCGKCRGHVAQRGCNAPALCLACGEPWDRVSHAQREVRTRDELKAEQPGHSVIVEGLSG